MRTDDAGSCVEWGLVNEETPLLSGLGNIREISSATWHALETSEGGYHAEDAHSDRCIECVAAVDDSRLHVTPLARVTLSVWDDAEKELAPNESGFITVSGDALDGKQPGQIFHVRHDGPSAVKLWLMPQARPLVGEDRGRSAAKGHKFQAGSPGCYLIVVRDPKFRAEPLRLRVVAPDAAKGDPADGIRTDPA
jgi:hypothetical protein